MRRGAIYILTLLMLLTAAQAFGQDETGKVERPAISMRADSIFASLKPMIDSTYLQDKTQIMRGFGTRFSIHTNMVDWAMTLPNIGLEYDLRRSTYNLHRNRRSLFFNVKYNGSTKENHKPKFVFNYMQVRGEYRKYWRTGNIGRERVYPEFKRINLHKPDSLYKDTFRISYPAEDTIRYKIAYLDSIGERIAAEYNGDPNRSWFYNHWWKWRRRISTRTVTDPRNWRAYFIGLYAMADKYSFCFGKKGIQGTGIGVGMSAGWSIPLLPRRYPNMGGLDLDLGASVGIRMVRNDKYRYNEEFRDYKLTHASNGFKMVPFPLLDEVRIALVYRFRSIGNKVDLALVDKYKKQIDRFEAKKAERALLLQQRKQNWESKQDTLLGQQKILNDSLGFWHPYHKRRLKNAWLLNPDTVFHDRDSVLEAELFPDSVQARIERKLQAQKDAKLRAKQQKVEEKEDARMAKEAEKEEREAEKADKKAKKEAEKAAKKEEKDAEEPTESPSDSSDSSDTSDSEASSGSSDPTDPSDPAAPEGSEAPEAPETPQQPESPEETPEEGGEE
ncbi:MAG: DUF3575 domain-containing protein [Bacteroidaceae bacterium]|nr:DUF3575 domain-containing protein [Bacteroidaceae bacterium]